MKKKLLTVFCLVVFLLGIGFYISSFFRSKEKLAIAVAKEEVRKRGWTAFRVTSVRFENERWLVRIERRPYEFGGHAIVEVSVETVYRPGR
ncbi:MAG: hypothetical protein KIS67_20500 [Verrucomicrobiae bacterium]|nr:hypothetical protein [Verrucomicrobiae bacterium]